MANGNGANAAHRSVPFKIGLFQFNAADRRYLEDENDFSLPSK